MIHPVGFRHTMTYWLVVSIPLFKYEFVRLDHHPSYWGNKIHVPNHQIRACITWGIPEFQLPFQQSLFANPGHRSPVRRSRGVGGEHVTGDVKKHTRYVRGTTHWPCRGETESLSRSEIRVNAKNDKCIAGNKINRLYIYGGSATELKNLGKSLGENNHHISRVWLKIKKTWSQDFKYEKMIEAS